MSKTEQAKHQPLEVAPRTYTLEELAKFDGENGAPAYIAVHGKVYDITAVNLFKDGRHHGVTPGNDVTELFVHKSNILSRLGLVGWLE